MHRHDVRGSRSGLLALLDAGADASGLLGSARALAPADGSAGDALRARPVVSRRVLAASALLLVALVAGLYVGLRDGRAGVAPTRLHAASHLRSAASSRRKGLSSLPLAAQGPVSDALGAESPAYRFRALKGGILGASPAQHLQHELQPLRRLRQLGLHAGRT